MWLRSTCFVSTVPNQTQARKISARQSLVGVVDPPFQPALTGSNDPLALAPLLPIPPPPPAAGAGEAAGRPSDEGPLPLAGAAGGACPAPALGVAAAAPRRRRLPRRDRLPRPPRHGEERGGDDEIRRCVERLEREDAVPYDRDFDKEPVLVGGAAKVSCVPFSRSLYEFW
jgi:hypothetical protein